MLDAQRQRPGGCGPVASPYALQGMGSGWSLPAVAQLQSEPAAHPLRASCMPVSNQFRLRTWWFWSSEANASSEGTLTFTSCDSLTCTSADSSSGDTLIIRLSKVQEKSGGAAVS